MDTVQQEQPTRDKKNKIPLLIIIVLLLLLSPLGGYFLLKGYLEKTIYEDRRLILQYEAEEALDELPFSSITKGFLGAVSFVYDEYFNEYFLLPDTVLVDLISDYDYTEKNAVFEVIGEGIDDNSLSLRFVFPSSVEGLEIQSQIQCSVNTTVAGEITTASMEEWGEQAIGTFTGYDKEFEIEGRISEFLLGLLERSDVKSGHSRLYLKGLCSDYDCSSVLDNCLVEVIEQ